MCIPHLLHILDRIIFIVISPSFHFLVHHIRKARLLVMITYSKKYTHRHRKQIENQIRWKVLGRRGGLPDEMPAGKIGVCCSLRTAGSPHHRELAVLVIHGVSAVGLVVVIALGHAPGMSDNHLVRILASVEPVEASVKYEHQRYLDQENGPVVHPTGPHHKERHGRKRPSESCAGPEVSHQVWWVGTL